MSNSLDPDQDGRFPESIFDRVPERIFDRVPESIFDNIHFEKKSAARQLKHAKLPMECSGSLVEYLT